MTDTIVLQGLRVVTLCGALPEERVRPQPFELDVEVFTDLAPAGRSDELSDTIDYGELCATISTTLEREQFTLLERMAERVAELVLADERAVGVRVNATKLRPPVPHQLATSGVRIERRKPS